jgi:Tetratricopeptide repeat
MPRMSTAVLVPGGLMLGIRRSAFGVGGLTIGVLGLGARRLGARIFRVDRRARRSGDSRIHPEAGARGHRLDQLGDMDVGIRPDMLEGIYDTSRLLSSWHRRSRTRRPCGDERGTASGVFAPAQNPPAACTMWRMFACGRCAHRFFLVIAFVLLGSGARAQSRPPASKLTISQALAGARTLLAANDLAGARATLETALAQNPASAEAHYLLGIIAERQNDLSAASASYQEAIHLNPKLAPAHDRLGFVLGRLGRTEEALAEFERATQLAPDLFDAQYHLGATRWWTKDLDGALTALQAAVRLQPAHAEAR